MTCRRGRQIRKTGYRPASPPANAAHNPEPVECPLCGREFDAAAQDDPTVDVRCPGCHEPVTPELLDMKVRALFAGTQGSRATVADVARQRATLERKTKGLPRPLRCVGTLLAHRAIKRAEASAQAAQELVSETDSAIARLAFQRFHLDRWHRETGCPLRWEQDGRSNGFSVHYTGRGTFSVSPVGSGGRGAASERAVYEQLLEASRTKGSPLEGAAIIPCLRIPTALIGAPGSHGTTTTEVDCVVVTSSGLVVIEVKRAPWAVVAPPSHGTIYRRCSTDKAEPAPGQPSAWNRRRPHHGWDTHLSAALKQNEFHARCVDALPIPVCRDQILEQVVLVDVQDFVGDESFSDGVGVSYSKRSDAAFVRALEQEVSNRPRVLQDPQIPKVEEVLRRLRGVSLRQNWRCQTG